MQTFFKSLPKFQIIEFLGTIAVDLEAWSSKVKVNAGQVSSPTDEIEALYGIVAGSIADTVARVPTLRDVNAMII